MLNLDPDDFKEVLIILRSHLKNCDVFAFGSRGHGRCRKFSDLDICIKGSGEIQTDVLNELQEAFSLSSLPVSVDIVDYHAVSDSFKAVLDHEEKILLMTL